MKNKKLLIILFSILSIYSIIGFIAIPMILKPKLIEIINQNITKKATLEKIRFNPFTFHVTLRNFKIKDKDKTIISFGKLYVDFSLFKSIDKKHIRFAYIELEDPVINIIENEDSKINIINMIKTTSKKQKETNTKDDNSNIINFLISKTELENATINYTKLSKTEPFSIKLKNLNYILYDLGSFKNMTASQTLHTIINENTSLDMKGGFRLTPLQIYGNISLKQLKPYEILPYKKNMLNFQINKDANIDLNLGYQVNMNKELKVKIQKLNLDVKNINITQNNKSQIKLKNFNLKNLALYYPQQKVNINSVNLNDFYSNVIINKDKSINLQTLVKEQESKLKKKKETTTTKTKPWNINIKNINLNNTNLAYSNKISSDNLEIANLNINTKNLEFKNNNLYLKSFNIKDPKITYKNKKNLLYATIDKANLDINNFNFKNNNIYLDKAFLNNKSLNFNDKKNHLKANISNLNISANNISKQNNDIDIKQLTLNKKFFAFIDKNKNQFQAKNLNVIVKNLAYKNNILSLKESIVKNPYVSISLAKKDNTKQTNNKTKKDSTQVTKKDSKEGLVLNLGPMKISNAKLLFEDKNLPIPFKTLISKLNGAFSELNSSNLKPATFNVEGKVNKYGYTKITGLINEQNIKELTDVNMIFKNIAIKNFTPYSSKFVGREIANGKLDLDLKYNIKKSNLKAKNKIIISNIRLGKEVKSKDAVSLPLELAIALLENKDGVIDLDIPITGNVDDPQFAIAPIVWHAFTNLIIKAVSSPFNLLASLLGIEPDKIKSIDFIFAEHRLLDSEKEALDNIAKILIKRPNLAIKINPAITKEDKAKLQELKAEKLINDKMKNSVEKNKYQVALESIYLSYKDSKNLDEIKKLFINDDEKLDITEYLKYLKNKISLKQNITKESIQELTNARIKNIKDYLIIGKKISNNKIIIEKQKTNDTNKNFTKYELEVSVAKK
ncbi:DUF748 domain-containing protein [Arcobacter sp. CECT 8985]|uniref:DUF748 domain-containing protein n=1 Tax=Arcobacter sp. CECT 8985 TaxID=1935424 RepID=UPI00100AC83B|nr:DUF748 domain-containing protein [Arcobacter sp. CECT 8985]RXJ88031.1 hypothetical protein CRU93_00070 [Arcobacter sp. CECT 8985]